MQIRWSDLFPYMVIFILIGFIWFRGCERQVQIVEVPGKSGQFTTDTIIKYVEQTDTIYIQKWNEIEVPTTNPVNQELLERYKTAQDSLEQFKLYVRAIEERTFVETLENDDIRIDINGRVRGHILGLTTNYHIKPQTIEVREPRFRLLGGFNLGNNTNLSEFQWKASIGLQNGQGNIFRLGYGDNETIWLGYEASLIRF